jgi:hypothetical protein
MSLPSFVSSAILWSVPRQGDRFVVALSPAALVGGGVAKWFKSAGCKVSRSAEVPDGLAFLVAVPPALVPSFRRLRSGGMGSNHPSNFLSF